MYNGYLIKNNETERILGDLGALVASYILAKLSAMNTETR